MDQPMTHTCFGCMRSGASTRVVAKTIRGDVEYHVHELATCRDKADKVMREVERRLELKEQVQ